MRFWVFIILIVTSYSATHAQDTMTPLMGKDIQSAIVGNTLEGFYQYEDVQTGEQSYEETYAHDGELLYKEGDMSDRGKWWIANNQLCHNYDIDIPKIDHCFFIYRDNNCFYYFESYYAQTGEMRHAKYWNNRSIIRGEGKTCELLVS